MAAAPAQRSFVGVLLIEGAIDLRADMEGRVETVLASLGAHVAFGTALVTIAAPALDAETLAARSRVDVAHARVEREKALLREARQRLARRRGFTDGYSVEELTSAETGAFRRRTELAAALAAEAAERADLERLEALSVRKAITAPFEGVVGLRWKEVGSSVQVGDRLLRLLPYERPILRFAVPPAEASSALRLGRRLALTVEGSTLSAAISRWSTSVDPPSGMVIAEADLSCPTSDCDGLLDGMSARVRLLDEAASRLPPQTSDTGD